jgi:hypothetical protein
MGQANMWDDRGSYAIGGGTLIGLGVGFFFLRESTFYFVGCLLLGIGLGLMVTAVLSRKKE